MGRPCQSLGKLTLVNEMLFTRHRIREPVFHMRIACLNMVRLVDPVEDI
jgi:hypothetical protein